MSEQNKIDEIKATLAAATPGTWVHEEPWSVKTADDVLICSYSYPNNAQLIAKAPEYITYLLAEIERKDEALRFYENKENWELPSFGRGHSAVISDRGKRAREAL